MQAQFLKKAVPHIIAVVLFLIVAAIYCKPALEGKVLSQSDVLGWKGMAQQSIEFKEKYGYYPLWTESMFSGMPTYNIVMGPTTQITIGVSFLSKLLTLGLPKPINFFFLSCISFYFLSIVLRVRPWVGMIMALAFAYSSFNPILVAAGHDSEILAIGYAPGVIASFLLILDRKYLWGACLFTLFFAFQISTVHLQIVYYTFISLSLLTLFFIIQYWKQRPIKGILTALVIALTAGFIGFCVYADSMLPIQEYAKETMRGGRTELTSSTSKLESNSGLSTDYAFQWSAGIGETLTLVVPNVYGGASNGRELGADSKFVEKLVEAGYPEDTAIQETAGMAYWGDQPSSSPIYLGIVVCFFFIIGVVFVNDWSKWWLLSIAVIGIVLSWGKHFSAVNNFLFNHLPYYNHFRSPTMAIVLTQFAFPLLGALGLEQILKKDSSSVDLHKLRLEKFKTAMYIVGGLLIFLIGFYVMSEYKAPNDVQLKTGLEQKMQQALSHGKPPSQEVLQRSTDFSKSMIGALQSDRHSLYGADLLRGFVLIAVAGLLTWFFLKGKMKWAFFLAGLFLLIVFDLLGIDSRYLNEDRFFDQSETEASFTPTAADLQIQKDPDKNFRVYDVIGGPSSEFQMSEESSRTSYFHNSIGGYSPAKLGLYQDIIENQLEKGNIRVFNMLNAKYFIEQDPATQQQIAKINPDAYGPCWLVKSIHFVKDGNEEMKALDSINTRDTVIIQQQYAPQIKFQPVPDSAAYIRLIENRDDRINYQFSAGTAQFAVFSEVYYSKGWNAFLDGKPADYFRVDYILRGMPVPSGKHTIEFRFEPHSYILGNAIAITASIITYLLLITAIILSAVSYRKKLAAN